MIDRVTYINKEKDVRIVQLFNDGIGYYNRLEKQINFLWLFKIWFSISTDYGCLTTTEWIRYYKLESLKE